MCGSLTSSNIHGPSAHLYVFAKYIQSVDGGNLAPLLQRKFFTAPYPLLNIGIENLQKQICSNDGNLAPPQTEQLSMLKRGCGDASSSHRRCLLCRWCKISSIHSMTPSRDCLWVGAVPNLYTKRIGKYGSATRLGVAQGFVHQPYFLVTNRSPAK